MSARVQVTHLKWEEFRDGLGVHTESCQFKCVGAKACQVIMYEQ